MLVAALEAEVEAYVAEAKGERDEKGHARVTRNGKARERTVVTGAGVLPVRAPRVNDRRVDEDSGERVRFRSDILPPYARKSPKVSHVLPCSILHGLSSGDFVPALAEFFGTDAGLSPAAITRLTTAWQAERAEFMSRPLKDRDYVYVWVDGIHFNVGSEVTIASVAWSWWACAPTAARSWSRSKTATGNRPRAGRSCCEAARSAACGPLCWQSATVRSGSGPP